MDRLVKYTLEEIGFQFLPKCKKYDSDSFPFDYKRNGNPFGSYNPKENCHSNHIPRILEGFRNPEIRNPFL